jgi:hypothetical protein
MFGFRNMALRESNTVLGWTNGRWRLPCPALIDNLPRICGFCGTTARVTLPVRDSAQDVLNRRLISWRCGHVRTSIRFLLEKFLVQSQTQSPSPPRIFYD